MNILVYPTKRFGGTIEAPPSKSYTHRYLFIALLSSGETNICNPLISNDTIASYGAIQSFGAGGSLTKIYSEGVPGKSNKPIHCHRSGTTCRFSISIASLVDGTTVIDGSPQLRRRPNTDLLTALRSIGVKIVANGGKLPIFIKGGSINNREVSIKASKSSQFISALMLLGAKIGLTIHTIDDVVSRKYIDLTIKCLEEAGVKIYRDDYKLFHVEAKELIGREYIVPGDYSSASFIITAAALGGEVSIKSLDPLDKQPDLKILEIVRGAGASVIWREDELLVSSGRLESFETSLKDSPDLLPITAVLAAFARGRSIIRGIAHNKYKESNRIHSVRKNLSRMGIKVECTGEKLIIHGGRPRANIFHSYGDHRIAMAFTVASLFLNKPSKLLNVDVINDSYPTFIQHIRSLGGVIREE